MTDESAPPRCDLASGFSQRSSAKPPALARSRRPAMPPSNMMMVLLLSTSVARKGRAEEALGPLSSLPLRIVLAMIAFKILAARTNATTRQGLRWFSSVSANREACAAYYYELASKHKYAYRNMWNISREPRAKLILGLQNFEFDGFDFVIRIVVRSNGIGSVYLEKSDLKTLFDFYTSADDKTTAIENPAVERKPLSPVQFDLQANVFLSADSIDIVDYEAKCSISANEFKTFALPKKDEILSMAEKYSKHLRKIRIEHVAHMIIEGDSLKFGPVLPDSEFYDAIQGWNGNSGPHHQARVFQEKYDLSNEEVYYYLHYEYGNKRRGDVNRRARGDTTSRMRGGKSFSRRKSR